MRFPRPAVDEYVMKTVVVVLTLAVIEYTGLVGGQAGTIDWRFLMMIGVMFPVFRYLLEVLGENTDFDVIGRLRG